MHFKTNFRLHVILPHTCQPDSLKYMDKFLSIYCLMQFIANALQLIGKKCVFTVDLMNPHWLRVGPRWHFKRLCVVCSFLLH